MASKSWKRRRWCWWKMTRPWSSSKRNCRRKKSRFTNRRRMREKPSSSRRPWRRRKSWSCWRSWKRRRRSRTTWSKTKWSWSRRSSKWSRSYWRAIRWRRIAGSKRKNWSRPGWSWRRGSKKKGDWQKPLRGKRRTRWTWSRSTTPWRRKSRSKPRNWTSSSPRWRNWRSKRTKSTSTGRGKRKTCSRKTGSWCSRWNSWTSSSNTSFSQMKVESLFLHYFSQEAGEQAHLLRGSGRLDRERRQRGKQTAKARLGLRSLQTPLRILKNGHQLRRPKPKVQAWKHPLARRRPPWENNRRLRWNPIPEDSRNHQRRLEWRRGYSSSSQFS